MGIIELEQKRTGPKIYPGLDLEWKVIDEDQGLIRGYLAVFNNVDSAKDRIRPGAFKKTIAEALQRKDNRGKKYLWPLLWMHDPNQPIGGFIDAEEDQKGLLVTAQLDINTNKQGYPLNPHAMSVFSGFKMGYIDELSIGYKAIQKSYDKDGVRDLTEIQNFEGSAVTMNFAANELAQVTSVKSASGGSFPLADRNTPWSKSKAIKDIEAATGGDWSKASKYFFWSASNPTTEADHKLPFVAKSGGTMKAIPQAIISAAAAVQGARGGVKGIDDIDAVKSKIAGYYDKMGMTPPWSSKDKAMQGQLEKKDFNDRYRQECIADWLYSDFNNLTQALRGAIIDMFMIGDEPQSDMVTTILSDSEENKIGFISALQAYVQKGIDLDVPNYLTEQNNQPSNYYGYMTRPGMLEGKAGAVVSQMNADRMQGHVDNLMQCKDIIHSVAEDITRYITGNEAYVSDAGTTSKTANHTLEPFYRALKNATNNQPLTSTDGDLEQFSNWLQSQIGRGPNDAA